MKQNKYGQPLPIIEATLQSDVDRKVCNGAARGISQHLRPKTRRRLVPCTIPYSNMAHFTGTKKPWQSKFNVNIFVSQHFQELAGPYRVFFQTLFDLSERTWMEYYP
eukprot:scaffold4927_cov139-Amphora_coffeaeformis.AAC.13